MMTSPSPPISCPATPPLLPTASTPPPKSLMDSTTGKKRETNKRKKSRSGSPEEELTCAICLGEIENMSYTDKCFHKFCFTCLLEWSKVRPVCPLCKGRFSSIIHTIKSDDNYESYHLPPPPPPPPLPSANDASNENANVALGNFFDRLPELQALQRTLAERQQELHQINNYILPNLAHNDHHHHHHHHHHPNRNIHVGPVWRRRRGPATSEFRRQVYEQNLYVTGPSVSDVTGRYRECSPQWYRNNQAQTHRLVPWLNRELNVLLSDRPQQSSYLINLILDVIQIHDIRSPELHDRLLPYFGIRTEHFQHEFYNFARSVYDMVGFDRHAIYEPGRPNNDTRQQQQQASNVTYVISSESTDGESNRSENSDIEIVDEVRGTGSNNIETLGDRVRRRIRKNYPTGNVNETLPNSIVNPIPSTSRAVAIGDDDEEEDNDNVEIVDVIPPRQFRNFDVVDILTSSEEEEEKQRSRGAILKKTLIPAAAAAGGSADSSSSTVGTDSNCERRNNKLLPAPDLPLSTGSGQRKRTRLERRKRRESEKNETIKTSSSAAESDSEREKHKKEKKKKKKSKKAKKQKRKSRSRSRHRKRRNREPFLLKSRVKKSDVFFDSEEEDDGALPNIKEVERKKSPSYIGKGKGKGKKSKNEVKAAVRQSNNDLEMSSSDDTDHESLASKYGKKSKLIRSKKSTSKLNAEDNRGNRNEEGAAAVVDQHSSQDLYRVVSHINEDDLRLKILKNRKRPVIETGGDSKVYAPEAQIPPEQESDIGDFLSTPCNISPRASSSNEV